MAGGVVPVDVAEGSPNAVVAPVEAWLPALSFVLAVSLIDVTGGATGGAIWGAFAVIVLGSASDGTGGFGGGGAGGLFISMTDVRTAGPVVDGVADAAGGAEVEGVGCAEVKGVGGSDRRAAASSSR